MGGGRVEVALELLEDLAVRLAHDVREHVEPAPVRHPEHGLVQPLLGGLGEHGVEQRYQRLGALQREPALADELRLQEHLERLGDVQPGQDPDLLVVLGPGVRPLHPGLDPGPLLRVLDVHVLDADGAAVGVPQHAQDLPQLHPRLAAEPAGGELAVQVPQGQPVLVDVQVGVLALLVLQRVGVGHQVAADPVGVDELVHPGGLRQVVLVAGRDVLDPADRLVRDPQRLEHVVVEAVLAEQQRVDHPQEFAGLRPLDDPVIVGGGQRDRLADRQPDEGLLGRALVGGRVLHGTDADDASLAGHQPRHRVLGADRARVGQADRGAGEVLDRELAAAGLADHVLIRHPELAEVHGLGGLDAGHEQLPGAVALAHVDGQAEVDVLGLDQNRLAVLLGERVVHLRGPGQRPHHRVADEVGERHLAAASPAEVVVDHYPVVDQQLGRDGAHAGRGRHGEAGGHVRRGAGRGSAQPDLDRVLRVRRWWRRPGRCRESRRDRGRGAPCGGGRCRARRGGCRGRAACGRAVCWPACGWPARCAACGRDGGRRRCLARPGLLRAAPAGRRLLRRLWVVVGEEIPPGPVHRAGVCLIALVELVNQPFVGPEIGARRIGSRRCTRRRATAAVRWSGQIRGRLWGISRHGGHPPLPTLDYLSFPHTRLPGSAPELRPCLADRICPVTRRCGLCRAARAS